MREVIAIICSDIHLQAQPPIARSTEPNWWDAMARPLREVSEIQTRHACPVLIAGDIFDKWNSPPEVINFAFNHLPDRCYSVPGQHDLPYHAYADIRRSAYWTLCVAGKIQNIKPSTTQIIDERLQVGGFGWGTPLQPLEALVGNSRGVTVALAHTYIWKRGYSYVGAPESARVSAHMKNLTGWDVAAFGDNHKGFLATGGILNCGGFMRRKIDERDYQPHIGLLHDDATVTRHPLDCSADLFSSPQVTQHMDQNFDAAEFISSLNCLGNGHLDYSTAVRQHLEAKKIPLGIQKIVLHAMEQ